jgi:7-cyano-7-deazaguanine synthase in queuosine biosynthesis
MIAFLNLSGGVDSTYYAWRWMRENPKEKILLHHCLYMRARLEKEKTACDNILEYFRKNGLTNFSYIETGLQKGTFNKRIYDVEALSGMTGVILKTYPTITTVLLSYCREETAPLANHLHGGGTVKDFDPKHRYSISNHVVETIAQKQYEYLVYLDKNEYLVSKKQMIHEMPQELFEMTWYCRRPKNGNPCGGCHTCKKVKRALR